MALLRSPVRCCACRVPCSCAREREETLRKWEEEEKLQIQAEADAAEFRRTWHWHEHEHERKDWHDFWIHHPEFSQTVTRRDNDEGKLWAGFLHILTPYLPLLLGLPAGRPCPNSARRLRAEGGLCSRGQAWDVCPTTHNHAIGEWQKGGLGRGGDSDANKGFVYVKSVSNFGPL